MGCIEALYSLGGCNSYLCTKGYKGVRVGRLIRAFSADLEDHGLMRVQRLVYGYIWKVDVIDKLTPILIYNMNEFIRLFSTVLTTGGSGSLTDSRNDCRFFCLGIARGVCTKTPL